jgi:predicted CXXCH cytochrome family protein
VSAGMRNTFAMIAALALAACASVLGFKRPSETSRPFEHRAHVLHGVACTQCHQGIAASSHTGPMHTPSTTTCTECHKKPHDSHDCNGCHGETWIHQQAELVHQRLRFDHGKHMAAVNGNCTRCHEEVGRPSNATGSLEPKMATCFGCHEHQSEWDLRNCNGCHVDVAKEDVTPESHVVHDGDFIREHGVRATTDRELCATCHDDRSCAKCHGVTVPTLPWKMGIGERPQMTGLHLSGFRSRHSMEARAEAGLCATCHSENFCVQCHTTLGVGALANGAKNPHPPGWVTASGGQHGLEARTDPMSCAGCHGGGGEQLCVGCHRVGGPGGNPHGPGFASNKDKVRDMPCRLCHGGS